MPLINEKGQKYWVPSMSPKGLMVLKNRRRYTLLHGTRKATKSNTAQHCLVSHCFQNDGAIAAIVVKGLTMSVGSGVWDDITGPRGILEKEWFRANIGCRYTKKPTLMSDTKMRYCEITTQNGGTAMIQLLTLARGEDTPKFKDSRFSLIYFVEADRWDTAQPFFDLIPQLRVPDVPYERRGIILDCNPPREGEDHWLHEIFMRDSKGRYPPDVNPDYMEVSFNLNDDNPFITQAEKLEIYDANKHDPVDLARNWEGKWVRSKAGSAFEDQYSPSIHIIGSASSGTCLLPPKGSFELAGGWDLGDAMNHASVIACPVTRPDGLTVAYAIDENVKVGVNSSIRKFTEQIMEKREYWDKVLRSRGSQSVMWRDFSDQSNLRYSAVGDRSAAEEVYGASGGAIELVGTPKGAGSIATRLNYLKRLLYDRRLFVSGTCIWIIRMLNELKEDKYGSVPDNDRMKHVFDALTYMLPYILPQAPKGPAHETESRIITI